MKLTFQFRDEPTPCPACRRSVSATRRSDEPSFRVSKHLFGSDAPNVDGFYEFNQDGFCPGSGEVATKVEDKKRKGRR